MSTEAPQWEPLVTKPSGFAVQIHDSWQDGQLTHVIVTGSLNGLAPFYNLNLGDKRWYPLSLSDMEASPNYPEFLEVWVDVMHVPGDFG